MSLFTATLITAGILMLLGVLLIWNSPQVQNTARGWPRSRRAAIILMGIGGAWFLYHVWHLKPADFGDYKLHLFIGFLAVGILSFFHLPDFLAVRGLGIVLLLSARELLAAAYMQEPQSRLLLVSFVYVVIVLTLYVGASPYRMRDFNNWLFESGNRPRVLGGFLGGYGLLLAGVAFNYPS